MSRPDKAARVLLDEMRLTTLPIDPERVAHQMDATVVRRPLDADVSGMLLSRDGQTVIGLNSEMESERQRFALAHLVGHLHLHRSRELILDTVARHSLGNVASLPTDREEAEANRFAAALLAPEDIVRDLAAEAEFGTSARLIDLLAPRFQLNRSAMAVRLMSLGIILDV